MQQNAIQYMQQIRKTPSIQSAFGSNIQSEPVQVY